MTRSITLYLDDRDAEVTVYATIEKGVKGSLGEGTEILIHGAHFTEDPSKPVDLLPWEEAYFNNRACKFL